MGTVLLSTTGLVRAPLIVTASFFGDMVPGLPFADAVDSETLLQDVLVLGVANTAAVVLAGLADGAPVSEIAVWAIERSILLGSILLSTTVLELVALVVTAFGGVLDFNTATTAALDVEDLRSSKYDPEYDQVWLPPQDQTGDGKTKLNEKFGK